MTPIFSIPLAQLCPDDYFQPRLSGLSEQHVQLLLESDPATWPPLLVRPNDEGSYDLIDGFHRYEAAQRLGLTELPCHIDPEADYFTGVTANSAHGLPLNRADRKAAARWLLHHQPELSFREIGRRVGLNHETVKRALEENELEDGASRQARRPDPVVQLVRQVERTYRAGHGRNWGGFGKGGNTRPFRLALETYPEEDRGEVARALDAFGRACVDAATPYLK